MSALVAVQNPDSRLTFVLDGITSVVRIDLPRSSSTSPGMCAGHTLDATGKVKLHLYGLLGVSLCAIGLMMLFWLSTKCQKKPVGQADAVELESLRQPLTQPLNPQPTAQTVLANVLPLHVRIADVLANAAFSMYSSLVSTTSLLLHCVSLPGLAGTFQFIQASRSCSAGLSVVLSIVIVLVSAVLIALTVWASQWHAALEGTQPLQPQLLAVQRETSVLSLGTEAPASISSAEHTNLVDARTSRLDGLKQGVANALCAPYTHKRSWWEAVLLLHRLALVLLFVFFSRMPVVQSFCAALVCFLACLLHVLFEPMRGNPPSQRLQTVLLSCLVIAALARIQNATQVQEGTAVSGASQLMFMITFVCLYVLPVAALAVSYMPPERAPESPANLNALALVLASPPSHAEAE
jgi:hypothetical protein